MRVFCRFAPLGNKGTAQTRAGKQLHVTLSSVKDGGQQILTVAEPVSSTSASLTCDGVFFPSNANSQAEIFDSVVIPLIDKAHRGGKGTVLCYGQTATGKTHTIFGPDGGNTSLYCESSLRGIVPRLADSLFDCHEDGSQIDCVEVRFYEIYNEVVTDLVAQLHYDIDSKPRKTQYKSTEKAKVMRSLHHMRCSNPRELHELLLTLSEMRLLYATENNAKSSRSHVVIQLNLVMHGHSATGQLTIVDLAGSESLKHTQSLANGGSTGLTAAAIANDIFAPTSTAIRLKNQANQRRLETRNINTSLFALKKVISGLYTQSRHISYKDSMLTTVLEDSLNPDAALIACCSSAGCDSAETLATLRFAMEASKIQIPEILLSHQRAEGLREALRLHEEASAAVAGRQEDAFVKILQNAKRDTLQHRRVTSAPSSVYSSKNTSICENERDTSTEEHSAGQNTLIENLKRLATDQREHIETLEDEIDRLNAMLLEAEKEKEMVAATPDANLYVPRSVFEDLVASHKALSLRNQQLESRLLSQKNSYEEQLNRLQVDLSCAKNELRLMDASSGGRIKQNPDQEVHLTKRRGSLPNDSSTTTIEMDATPSVADRNSFHESRFQSPRKAHHRAGSKDNATAVIQDVSDYIASVRAQLTEDGAKAGMIQQDFVVAPERSVDIELQRIGDASDFRISKNNHQTFPETELLIRNVGDKKQCTPLGELDGNARALDSKSQRIRVVKVFSPESMPCSR